MPVTDLPGRVAGRTANAGFLINDLKPWSSASRAPRLRGHRYPGRQASKGDAVKPGRRDLGQLVIRPLRSLCSDWRDPVLRNGYALIINVGITSVLGLVYWILAAHLYTPTEVGIGVAAINLMQFLVGLGGQLTFQAGLTRFIPDAGRDSTRLALLSYSLASCAGVVVSLAYIGGLHIHALGLPDVLGRSWILSVALGVSVTVWCVFALQDAVLTGIRQAIWSRWKTGCMGSARSSCSLPSRTSRGNMGSSPHGPSPR